MTTLYFDGELIRNRIKELITQADVSDREVSLSIGKSASYIHEILSGRYLPSMEVFLVLCEYFGITPKEFFDSEEKNPIRTKKIVAELQRLLGDNYGNVPEILERMSAKDIEAFKRIYTLIKNTDNLETSTPLLYTDIK